MFDQHDPTTLASNSYTLGVWLEVTRLDTGDRIYARVTDRGGFRHPILVDLSAAAFERLAPLEQGVIPVRVELRSIKRVSAKIMEE